MPLNVLSIAQQKPLNLGLHPWKHGLDVLYVSRPLLKDKYFFILKSEIGVQCKKRVPEEMFTKGLLRLDDIITLWHQSLLQAIRKGKRNQHILKWEVESKRIPLLLICERGIISMTLSGLKTTFGANNYIKSWKRHRVGQDVVLYA